MEAIMFEIKRILFPTDFCEHCRGAIAYAEALAGRFDAELTLLHVIEPPEYNSVPDDLRRIEVAELEDWLGPDRRYFSVKFAIERGEAAHEIARYACANHSDLILMPTRGMGRYRRLTLGSSTAKVLHDAECPVWTGVHLKDAPPLGEIHFRKIVCGVDFLVNSTAILAWASGFAQEYQAELTLVHATPQVEAGPEHFMNREYELAMQARSEEAMAELQQRVGTSVAVRVEGGDPAAVLRNTALELDADLVVIGRSAASGLLGRLSKNSYAIVSHSPCPVVSV
jgi:nucleotide-binding universal stress UspA family protein